jgi:rRNA maturation protein Nop10
MSRWKLKSCPRCRGDVYTEREADTLSERCLQCGFVHYLSLPRKSAVQDNRNGDGQRYQETNDRVMV